MWLLLCCFFLVVPGLVWGDPCDCGIPWSTLLQRADCGIPWSTLLQRADCGILWSTLLQRALLTSIPDRPFKAKLIKTTLEIESTDMTLRAYSWSPFGKCAQFHLLDNAIITNISVLAQLLLIWYRNLYMYYHALINLMMRTCALFPFIKSFIS